MMTTQEDHTRALRDILAEIDTRIDILLDSPYAAISSDTGNDLEEIQVLIANALRATGGAA